VIALNNITFEFGGRTLYRNASWHIHPNERIGLIGLNGTGKSTLLRIIMGEYNISEGNISRQNGVKIGFFNQDLLSFETELSIKDVALSAFDRQLFLKHEIDKLLHIIETDYSDDNLHKLSDMQHEFEVLGGYDMDYKTEELLEGLGFTTADLARPFKEFSGGWRMRVMLAKLILQHPDLLMLDEPTNHLDLPSIQWLEEYLKTYDGTIIVVSHDRYFLDRLVNKIVEVASQKITIYSGNYSFYLGEKELRDEIHRNQFENQQAQIRQTQALIDRFKAKASKASMAKSKEKLLERMEKVEAPADAAAVVNFEFRIAQKPGRLISMLQDVSKAYTDKPILQHAHAEIVNGDKIALIGANGLGKSTVLRIIAGTEKFEGKIQPGYNVIPSFYAQHQLESLNLQHNMIEELQYAAPKRSENEIRTVLGCFLFTGDEVFKRIRVLSGGEKARIALAKTILSDANFLMLDEPTNHLDYQSVNILTQALQKYEGSYIIVSHDRQFISDTANKIWWIEDRQIKEYPGTYEEWKEWMENRRIKVKPKEENEKHISVVNNENIKRDNATVKREAADDKKRSPEEKKNTNVQALRKVKLAFEKCESEIAKMEEDKLQLEKDLSMEENIRDKARLAAIHKEYEQITLQLKERQQEYEKLFDQIMELENT
jgi:ATP-binding cassette subfamily F protein 3